MRVLKKLFLGDVVAKGTTRQLRKLTTVKPQEESIIGTWVFKDNIDYSPITNEAPIFSLDYQSNAEEYNRLQVHKGTYHHITYGFVKDGENSYYNSRNVYTYSKGWSALNVAYKTITITGGADINNPEFITWLKANATKQESIVGTWVFKDKLDDSITTTNTNFYCDMSCELGEFDYIYIAYYSGADVGYKNQLKYGTGGDKPSINNFDNVYSKAKNGWVDGCQTITINSEKSYTGSNMSVENTSQFITWLQANATKIA